MLRYSAPLDEYRFLHRDVLKQDTLLTHMPDYGHVDQAGCSLTEGQVKSPAGFAAAYDQYQRAGWPACTVPTN